jgi:AraC-like DNA-binding protein
VSATAGFLPGYHERPPPQLLAPWIECFWWRRSEVETPVVGGRILPDGRVDLVWSAEAGLLVAGPQTQSLLRPFTAPFVVVGARFHPGAAPPALGVPASDLTDAHVPLFAIDGKVAAALSGRLAEARTPSECFSAFGTVLVGRSAGLDRPDPLVRAVAAGLARPRARVDELAGAAWISERQLQRRFRAAVGYGPKTLQRVLRFQRLLSGLATTHAGSGDLARLAAWAGYADQAHLTRESRELSGLTPSQLRRWLAA